VIFVGYLKFIAFSGEDLLRDIDSRSDQRSKALHTSILNLDTQDGLAKFITSGGAAVWRQYIKFIDINKIPVEERNNVKAIAELKENYPEVIKGDILVGCTCPAFTYFYAYIVSQLDSILPEYQEGRYPIVRNPRLEGTVCKHLISTIQQFLV
jgi:hypothetical protein